MDMTDIQNGSRENTDSKQDPIRDDVWKGYAMSEIAHMKGIDPENISIFDVPCFKEFTQEEEKITHRMYIFYQSSSPEKRATLFDFSFWKGDHRPPIERGIVPVEKNPFLEDDFSALFELDIMAPSNQLGETKIQVRYSKKENTLEIHIPETDNNTNIIDTNGDEEDN